MGETGRPLLGKSWNGLIGSFKAVKPTACTSVKAKQLGARVKKAIHFYFQNLNTFRLFTSGGLFCFAIYCLVWNPDLPFTLPVWVYALAFLYFAVFPVKDMVSRLTEILYKGKQFQKNYQPAEGLSETEFQAMKKQYDRGAARSMAFWLCFLGVVGLLKYYKVIGREWIFFFFAMSNFCIFFAVFFLVPVS